MTAKSPTLTPTITPTPETTAIAEASNKAVLDMGKTQNAAYFATSADIMTARQPTARPTDEGLGALVHDADTRTGLDEVDQSIDIVLAGGMNEFWLRFKISACTHEMALGGPENCRVGEPEGALVEVLPFLGSREGSQLRKNVRQGPGLDSQQLTGIEPGTIFMIIDGSACANNWFWWKVELNLGLAGWVAEGGDNIDLYFICPLN
ncbi:MAG TPA: SH3 domain-containing protein [Anaerolineales bacterium]|nr:SH3 domain-containing protein [Anaerolineales bacterium]